MKYCLHCGCIYADSFDEYENERCGNCGFKLIEDTDITEEQFIKLSESEKDAYEWKIYNICKQSEFFDENKYYEEHSSSSNWYFTFRFDKYEQLTGEKAWTKENDAYHTMESHKRVQEALAKHAETIGKSNTNIPKCPTCQSSDINKVSRTSKAISVAMFGFLSQKVKKQFHCNSCGYEWWFITSFLK